MYEYGQLEGQLHSFSPLVPGLRLIKLEVLGGELLLNVSSCAEGGFADDSECHFPVSDDRHSSQSLPVLELGKVLFYRMLGEVRTLYSSWMTAALSPALPTWIFFSLLPRSRSCPGCIAGQLSPSSLCGHSGFTATSTVFDALGTFTPTGTRREPREPSASGDTPVDCELGPSCPASVLDTTRLPSECVSACQILSES